MPIETPKVSPLEPEATQDPKGHQINDLEEQGEKKAKRYDDLSSYIEYLNTTYDFRYNTLRSATEYAELDTLGNAIAWKELNDRTVNSIHLDGEMFGWKVSKVKFEQFLESRHVVDFCPITTYLDRLRQIPDGRGKYIKQLCETIKLSKTEHAKHLQPLLTRWLIATVSGWIGKGRNEVCLVLAGSQGKGKTSWIRRLFPEELRAYCVEGSITPSLTDRTTCTYLVEKIFINIDDQLDGIFQKDFNSLKSIITQDKVSLRKMYGKRDETRRRIATFCATVNQLDFLRDTENRRYMVLETNEIDFMHAVPIDYVYREVLGLIDRGATPWYTAEERKAIADINDEYTEITSEAEFLATHLNALPNQPDAWHSPQTYILDFLQKQHPQIKLSSRNLVRALQRQKFGYGARKVAGVSSRGYFFAPRTNQAIEYFKDMPQNADKNYTLYPDESAPF